MKHLILFLFIVVACNAQQKDLRIFWQADNTTTIDSYYVFISEDAVIPFTAGQTYSEVQQYQAYTVPWQSGQIIDVIYPTQWDGGSVHVVLMGKNEWGTSFTGEPATYNKGEFPITPATQIQFELL